MLYIHSLTMYTTHYTTHYTYYIYSQEVYKHGMVEANFSPQNKLLRLEMAFDVMSFMQQLRRSSGRYDFQVCRVSNMPIQYMLYILISNDIHTHALYYIHYTNTHYTNTLLYYTILYTGGPQHPKSRL